MRLEKPISAPVSFSEVPPKSLFKQFPIDEHPLSSFKVRSSSTSSSYASLLEAIDRVIIMFLALCPHVVSQDLNTSDPQRRKPLVVVQWSIDPGSVLMSYISQRVTGSQTRLERRAFLQTTRSSDCIYRKPI